MTTQAVIFISIPATGKSTFFRVPFFDTHIRLNLEMLRTRHREQVLLKAFIEGKQSFVVDNTNATVEYRKKCIQLSQIAAGVQRYTRVPASADPVTNCLHRNADAVVVRQGDRTD